jgi:hypothetical protein
MTSKHIPAFGLESVYVQISDLGSGWPKNGSNSTLLGLSARVFGRHECKKWPFGGQKALVNLQWTHMDHPDQWFTQIS